MRHCLSVALLLSFYLSETVPFRAVCLSFSGAHGRGRAGVLPMTAAALVLVPRAAM
eukprot:SAG22_NODE_1584_length_4060_cov_81.610452_5_plen_56_part_00